MLNFGGFLSSNFWNNYRCQSSQSIEDLLNSKDCSVDKLLDDDDCLQELKNFNEKLIKYFDHDKLKVLIDYITVMPTEEDGQGRGHKYPFLAGEIFNCEINQVLDKFFEAPVKAQPEAEVKEEEETEDKKEEDTEDKHSAEDKEEKTEEKSQEQKDDEIADAATTDKKEEEEATSDKVETVEKTESPEKATEDKDTAVLVTDTKE